MNQGISLDHDQARSHLQAAITLAESDKSVPEEWEERAEIIGNLQAKTYTPFLGTALLAKATDGRIDALAIKMESGPGGYSARGLCHKVLVPASRENQFSIRNTGPEPLNNQPFFRYDRVDQVERVKNDDLHERLVPFLKEANKLSPDEARMALAAFL